MIARQLRLTAQQPETRTVNALTFGILIIRGEKTDVSGWLGNGSKTVILKGQLTHFLSSVMIFVNKY